MGIIVSKFGGSSTASASHLKRIERLVRASGARRCVVLSAPGIDGDHPEKVTAMLERCWDLRKCPAARESAVSAVVRRFGDICRGLELPDMTRTVRRTIERALSVSLPQTLSRGEYLCALAFAATPGCLWWTLPTSLPSEATARWMRKPREEASGVCRMSTVL